MQHENKIRSKDVHCYPQSSTYYALIPTKKDRSKESSTHAAALDSP